MTPYADAARALRQTVWNVDRQHDIEIEFRLGSVMRFDDKTRFTPGIRQEAWSKLKAHLDGAECWESTHHGVVEDRIAGGVRMTGDTCIQKRKVWSYDFDDGTSYQIRASIAVESPVAHPKAAVRPYVRRKERFSYVWKCWRYDLTHVTSNSLDDLDADGTFEVELEFWDPLNLVVVPMSEVMKWGHQIMKGIAEYVHSAVKAT